MEIGDSFRIVIPKVRKRDNWGRCKTPEKEFVITGFTKNNYVYYDDLRTNIRCNCTQCSQGDERFYRVYIDDRPNNPIKKRVTKDWVVITQKKAERERHIKLKLILRK